MTEKYVKLKMQSNNLVTNIVNKLEVIKKLKKLKLNQAMQKKKYF